MEVFKFGTDREDIGLFVSASLPIVCPSGGFKSLRQHHRERHQNLCHAKKCSKDTRRFNFVLNSHVHTKIIKFRDYLDNLSSSRPILQDAIDCSKKLNTLY